MSVLIKGFFSYKLEFLEFVKRENFFFSENVK